MGLNMKSWSQRAPFNDWWYWSECLVKRFRTISDIYTDNGEPMRAKEAMDWSKKLKENCMVPVNEMRKGMKTEEEKARVRELEEEAIFNAAGMFRELLINLPFVSSAVQELLYVNWEECKWDEGEEPDEIDEETGLPLPKKKKKKNTDTRLAELFWGPRARTDEGIRSGKIEDGGLPGILANLLIAEKSSSSRTPTDYGAAMQAHAVQQQVATNQKWERAGVQMNFKPPGGI
jgi:hypothetical protein